MLKLFNFYIYLMEQAEIMEDLEEIRADLTDDLDNDKLSPQYYDELIVALNNAMDLKIEDYLIVQSQFASEIHNIYN